MIFTVLIIILYYQYYDTEDFSSISIIVMLKVAPNSSCMASL